MQRKGTAVLICEDRFLDAPVDFFLAVFPEKGVCLGEMLAAEKSVIGGQRTGMRRSQYQMLRVLDQSFFALALLPHSRNTTGFSR